MARFQSMFHKEWKILKEEEVDRKGLKKGGRGWTEEVETNG